MMFLVQMWSLNMIKTRLLSLMPDLVTDDLIKECCDLFNFNFDKAMNGKVIKSFPSRMIKYINNTTGKNTINSIELNSISFLSSR